MRRDFCLSDAKNCLFELKKMLDEAGIVFWLEGGTLLGAVREGQLLPWDHDMDLSVRGVAVPCLLGLASVAKALGYEFSPVFEGSRPEDELVRTRASLLEVKDLFDAVGIPFWLETGTLLGAMREGDFLPSADWTRLGSHCDYMDKLPALEMAAKSQGFEIFIPTTDMADSPLKRVPCAVILEKGGIKTEIALLFPEDEVNGWYPYLFAYGKPLEHYRTLGTLTLFGTEFNIPDRAEAYLEKRYGNWRKPAFSWDQTPFDHEFKGQRKLRSIRMRKNDILIDILVKYKVSDLYVQFLSPICSIVPEKFHNEVDCISLFGERFPIPAYVEEYLQLRFGNWRKPVQNWDSYRDDGTVYNAENAWKVIESHHALCNRDDTVTI